MESGYPNRKIWENGSIIGTFFVHPSFSFHFFEALLEAMVAPIILLLIPMNITALIIFGFVSFIFNVYGHLGYEIAPNWFRHSFLFQLMVTSTHHNIHHSKFKGNYGLYFRVWDRIMGTEHPDYVKEYDIIQERRFGSSIPSRKHKKPWGNFIKI